MDTNIDTVYHVDSQRNVKSVDIYNYVEHVDILNYVEHIDVLKMRKEPYVMLSWKRYSEPWVISLCLTGEEDALTWKII